MPDTPKREVRLWDVIGVVAVILEESGVVYTNQTCGGACMQPREEGVLIPFNNDPPLDEPEQSLEFKLSKLLANVERMTPEYADRIDAILAEFPTTRWARVDRSRLKDSHEAWVYVDLREDEFSSLKDFGECKAVLTWPNSD